MVLSHGEADRCLSSSEMTKQRSFNNSEVDEADQHRLLRDFELAGKCADRVFTFSPEPFHMALRHQQTGSEVVRKLLSPLR